MSTDRPDCTWTGNSPGPEALPSKKGGCREALSEVDGISSDPGFDLAPLFQKMKQEVMTPPLPHYLPFWYLAWGGGAGGSVEEKYLRGVHNKPR